MLSCDFFQGVCEKTIQDVVERFWDIIEEINVAKTLRFLKDNIVSKYCNLKYYILKIPTKPHLLNHIFSGRCPRHCSLLDSHQLRHILFRSQEAAP